MIRNVLRSVVLIFLASAGIQAQERCGVAKDFMVRALERITPGLSPGELEDALQLLKRSNELCAGLADAWYYRSIVERKLGRQNLADYALRKAKLLGSEALDQNADPFKLATAPTETVSLTVRDKWAVVIGIGKFRDKRITRLKYTTKDAQDFAALLLDKSCGRFKQDHVHTITDEEATTIHVKSELNWLARNAGKEDLAVIYLSSHGSPREMDTAGLNYVITYDTDVGDQDSLYATALPMVEVADVIRTRIKALRAAVFLDTCHSGGAVAGTTPTVASGISSSSPSVQMLDRIRQGVGRVIITSSQVNEKSWESDSFQNGYFTHYLIQALKQNQGLIPIGKVYNYLKEQVSKQVLTEVEARQTPVISRSDWGAEIVIGVAPAGTQAGLYRQSGTGLWWLKTHASGLRLLGASCIGGGTPARDHKAGG